MIYLIGPLFLDVFQCFAITDKAAMNNMSFTVCYYSQC
jgi:hypothetical protein